MSLRRALWFAVVTAAGLARSDANAQPLPPTAPVTSPAPSGQDRLGVAQFGVPLPQVSGRQESNATTSDRLQTLVSPPETPGPPFGAAPAAQAPVREDRNYALTSGWLDGLRFKSADDAFRVHVGG